MLTRALAISLVLALAAPGASAADECAERVAFIADRLEPDASRVRVWRWGWTIGYAAATAGQLGVAFVLDDDGDEDRRTSLYVGAAKAGIALGAHLLRPVATTTEQPRLAARVGRTPPCELVADAEAALLRSAASERLGRSWRRHAGVLALNTAALLVLGLGFDQWGDGLLSFGSGLLVGELQIWTQPTGAVRAEDAYRARWTITPALGPDGARGLTFALAF